MNNKLKIVFMGTPKFGANALKTLIDLNYVPNLVICQPDRNFNRKKEIVFSPVKKLALEYKIPIIQPEKIVESYEDLKNGNFDLSITAAYGQFIPKKILALFPKLAWNLHASLLPKLRGGAPIHWAIINGEKETGVSFMQMVSKMDAGSYLAQKKILILENDTYASLHDKLLILSQDLIKECLPKIIEGKYELILQNEKLVSFGYNIKKEDTFINWSKTDLEIDQIIRGLYPSPVAKTFLGKNILKILNANKTTIETDLSPGSIYKIDKKNIGVVCGNKKVINLNLIQFPNKKPMNISEVINGNFGIFDYKEFYYVK